LEQKEEHPQSKVDKTTIILLGKVEVEVEVQVHGMKREMRHGVRHSIPSSVETVILQQNG
jgi:hypothetical protein